MRGSKREREKGKSISAIAIERHIGTLMLTLAVLVVGVFLIFRLQVDLLPSITYPRIGVRVDAPGVSPSVAVEEVTKPLEEALSATEGVVQIFSQTREGRISLDLFFEPGGDIDQALNDATATLNRARSTLPNLIEEPRLFKFEPSQLPVYELALESSSLPDVDLRVFADQELGRELSIIPGVSSVNVSGGVEEEVRINIDPKRLEALGVTFQTVLDALRARNQDFSGGRLRGEAGEPLTRTVGLFESVGEIENLSLVIGENQNRGRIYLRDVAEVIDGTEEQRIFVFLNGKPAVKVSIQKQPDANSIVVVNEVKKRLEFLKESGLIPADMVLVTTLDESRFIRNSVANVISSGLVGTVLAAIAVFLFLGSLRQTLIIVIAIPLATLTAIILMKLFGLSINVFSLGGLALGVGIVVDNSIVMLENISSGVMATSYPPQPSLGNGKSLDYHKKQLIGAAAISSQEVESALIASTTTNLVAVLPFLFLGGLVSLLFNELILTISFAVAASLLLALTVVPMLASRLLGIRWSSGVSKLWFLRQFKLGFAATTRGYISLLKKVLRHRLLVILLVCLSLGGGAWWMFDGIPQEILPSINTGQANLIANFPPGTNLATNQKVMKAVDEIIREQPETEYVFTTVGGGLFANSITQNLLLSSSTITLKPGTDVEGFVERVNREFRQLNLVDIRLRLFPGRVRGITLSNSPIRADIDVILQGKDNKILEAAGNEVLKILDERVTRTRFRPDANSTESEIQIIPDWERLASLGLNTEDVGNTVRRALDGFVPTELQRGERLVDVRVQLKEEERKSMAQLEQLPLFLGGNRAVRLGDVATLVQGEGQGEIQRINQRNVFMIAGDLVEGAKLSEAIAEVKGVLADVELPPGVSFLPSMVAESSMQLQTSLKIIGGLAAFLVFVVMAVQYNSLIDPLVIMLTVPLALAGGIFGLFVTQTAIGATVLVGGVLLVGIVVNNAIIMVEFANQLREEYGISRSRAILKAAPQRLRPILMTTITTVLGLLPLALGMGEGGEFLQPLGVVVFSGLSLATLLTLFLIPCFYVLLHDLFGS
ncbi:MAG: efflux RND transporter permease subunit [Gomphosphaeria aponina SAG 52.96 = DSM 107014]|uniref:Efflux RND transporter permease subunit n=1 Tax=Gomphosphaeria aponina SAG 52.96 = DSM 107014 TaxID=1521640 RepID=A0A941GVY4_9CHRO|nr:efflux RND transporter permease subunit [Gomphosphaeria aponina SAG 52.96 = DSM 107014]